MTAIIAKSCQSTHPCLRYLSSNEAPISTAPILVAIFIYARALGTEELGGGV